jgi:hypothetical protein
MWRGSPQALALRARAEALAASGRKLQTEGSSGVGPRHILLRSRRVATGARHAENLAVGDPNL